MAEQATVHEAEAEHAARRRAVPDEAGFFGKYGGQYLPPELEAPFAEITKAYHEIENDAAFIAELRYLRKHFQGRPTPVYHARTLSLANGGAQIYLKREDLNHTGAHKLNHCMGEGLLAKYMGKKKLIAETGAGQHGVALATAAAHFGLECEIHMGVVDIEKQAPNVSRMQLLGATVVPVTHGLQTLKEAVDSAFEAYLADYENAIYCIGSVVGPAPVPAHGARLPEGRRHGGARAVRRDDRQPAGRGGGVRGRRQQRHGHLLRVPRRPGRADRRGAAGSRRGRGRQRRDDDATAAKG